MRLIPDVDDPLVFSSPEQTLLWTVIEHAMLTLQRSKVSDVLDDISKAIDDYNWVFHPDSIDSLITFDYACRGVGVCPESYKQRISGHKDFPSYGFLRKKWRKIYFQKMEEKTRERIIRRYLKQQKS